MDIATKSALGLSDDLAEGRVSSVEVMTATLDRIEAWNPHVNAIVSLRDRSALLAEAKAADQSERKGWLHGIPLAVKDLAHAKGLPTSSGSPLFAGQVAETDDLHIARMRAAGAIIIGKTNTPEFGLGSHTFNAVFGATGNPYNADLTCGGSSGGAAVSLATGMTCIADGSDMMGSLRNPATWNNVYGMRPTVNLVPTEPKPGADTYMQHLATNGPMARNPSDLAALLDTMAGPDSRQPFGLNQPLSLPEINADTTGRRLGWLGDWGGAYAIEDGILDLCQTALGQMQDMGFIVEELDAPYPSEAIWEPWKGLRHFAIASGLSAVFEDPKSRDRVKKTAQWEIENGLSLSGQDVHRLSAMRSDWFALAAELFATYDALILPGAQVWPFPVDTEYPTEINGRAMDTYHRWMEIMIPASLIGLPVVNVPIGFGANGMPMGMQIIGPRGGDARVLQIAQSWHKAQDWPSLRPPVLPAS